MFRAEITKLDLEKLGQDAAKQYTRHLHATNRANEAASCHISQQAATDLIAYDHTVINVSHADLCVKLKEFFDQHQISNERIDNKLIIHTGTLAKAGLTSQDAGKFLFNLNQELKAEQANQQVAMPTAVSRR